MRGRGRGRGTLSRWETSKPSGELYRVGSSLTVLPLSRKEHWDDQIQQQPEDSCKNDAHVRVTHIIDVEHFWAQIGSLDELKQFDTYMLALNSWCNEQQQLDVHPIPVCGQPVCVRHKDTSQWRRAQVTRLGNKMVDIFYLDYGQSECVPLDRICNSTPGDVLSRRAMAQYITLEGVQPIGKSWSDEANERFSKLVSSMSDKLTVHFSDNFRGKLYLRNSSGKKVAVGDMLISEGLAQTSDDSFVTGSWQMDEIHRAKLPNSEEQNKLHKQWNSLAVQPAASQQPTWKTGSAFTNNHGNNPFYTGQNSSSNSPFSSKEYRLPGDPFPSVPLLGDRVLNSPPEIMKGDMNDNISLSNVPLPPKPDLAEQGKEGDNLETFNLKRVDPGPVEAVRISKPHLASPKDFLSNLRGHEPGDTGHSSAHPAVLQDELPLKYQPPHTRDAPTNINDMAARNSEHKLESFTPLSQSNHSSFLQQHGQQPPFSNFTFSPKLGRSHIAAQFQTYVKNEDMAQNAQPQQQKAVQSFSQPEFIKVQPLNETTRDKTLKAELDWKIWKFQRNIKKLLDKIVANKMPDLPLELDKLIADSRLSQEFPGISELSIILSLLFETVMDGRKFHTAAVRVCAALRDMSSPELSDFLRKAVTQCQDNLMQQCSASDCHKRCHRFSSFLGELYLEVLTESGAIGLRSSLDDIVANCLHSWLSYDQAESLEIHQLNAVCLKSFLKVIGPNIDQTEGNEISKYFGTIRELVLSQDLEVSVKSILLDILLIRASGWKVEDKLDEQQETDNEFIENEVSVENNVTEEQQQEETGDQDDSEEWDPYIKVRSMLKNLKLQDLLPKFIDNCIRDSLLIAEWEELKTTLQEAGFPPGVILEIRMYLDKGLQEKDVKKSSRLSTDEKPGSSADLSQELKRASKSPSPTKTVEHNIEIKELNNELQQLMLSENQDKGAQKISPTRKISPPREQAGHDGTPYSRWGPRKYVSRAERRLSSEGHGEEVPQPVMEPLSDVFEKTAPFPVAPVEAANVSTSVETSQQQSQPVSSLSYSAVLKNASSETNKSSAVSGKPPNQSKTFSRPPPGLSALPTHGGDTTMHMTVLGAKSKSRATRPVGSAPRNAHTRADASKNWRKDSSEEKNMQGGMRQQQPPQQKHQRQTGHGAKWRRFDDVVQIKAPNTETSNEGGQRSDTQTGASGYASSEESPEPPPVVQPHRAFGPGGLKACVICGSREHLRCNDRSKLFLD